MSSPNYGPDGLCGRQHNNTVCLPVPPRSCCSINGFCGSNETYCFTSFGCQSDCVDPPAFYLTPSPSSSATSSTTQTTTSTATVTSTPTPIPAQPALTSQQKTGIIIGVLLFALVVVIALLIYLNHRRRHKPAADVIRFTQTDPSGAVRTLELPQGFAKQHPQIVGDGAMWAQNRQLPAIGASASMWEQTGTGTGASTQYIDNPDDFRFQDLSSEHQG